MVLPPSYATAVCRNSVTALSSELPVGLQVQVFKDVAVTCWPSPTGTPTAAPTCAGVNSEHESVSALAVDDRANPESKSDAAKIAPKRASIVIVGSPVPRRRQDTPERGVLPLYSVA